MSSEYTSSSDPAPFSLPSQVDPWILSSLVQNIFNNDMTALNQAVQSAMASGIPQMTDWGVVDGQTFLYFLSGMVNWVPSETCNGKLIYNTLCLAYFILDQPPLNLPVYSTQINPNSVGQPLAPLSQWTVDFANKIGDWMDTGGSISAEAIQSFQDSPRYNYDEAIVPEAGWQTFNELFARKLKPGMRPISAADPGKPTYDRVVVYPADSTFDGAWNIDQKDEVFIKDMPWKISDLLANSKYAPHFEGGIWMHAFLNTFDYHRQHAPVGGTVVEANVIPGLAYLQVRADPSTGKLKQHRSYVAPETDRNEDPGLVGTLDAPDDAGYQFLQSRGCVIIKNALLGYVAVLPIGMAQVSSVKLAWGPPYPCYPMAEIKKGDEISHFQFGGSDIVLVFQKDADLQVLGAQGLDAQGGTTSKQKYLVGMPLGYSTKAQEVIN